MTTATQTASKSRKRVTTRSLVVTAMLSAVAFLLMFIEVPIPGADPHLREDWTSPTCRRCWARICPRTRSYGVAVDLHQEPAPRPHPRHLHRLRGRALQLHLTGAVVLPLTPGFIYQRFRSHTLPAARPCRLWSAGAALMAVLSVPLQLLRGLPRLCGAAIGMPHRGHRRDVPGHPALCQQPAEVPGHLQSALHLLQGPD